MLRLEAQLALAKENEVIDPLTQLLCKDSMLTRLQEKTDNSRRNGLPFSLLYLSLRDFKIKHTLLDHEMDTTLLKVVKTMKQDIRLGVDIAARVGPEELLLALPGVSQEHAEQIAQKIKSDIFNQVKTPGNIAVEVMIGVAEYSTHADLFRLDRLTGEEEVNALLDIAQSQLGEAVA
nr:diguanylate cyclase [Methylomarinum sp. Ch1-1]MDP4522412.1 diguanylate cyclase [Methylomarinum sp. Ch1-1]